MNSWPQSRQVRVLSWKLTETWVPFRLRLLVASERGVSLRGPPARPGSAARRGDEAQERGGQDKLSRPWDGSPQRDRRLVEDHLGRRPDEGQRAKPDRSRVTLEQTDHKRAAEEHDGDRER